jgi:hypothetical protein
MPNIACRCLYTASVEFPCLDKIDRFVLDGQRQRDRVIESIFKIIGKADGIIRCNT